MDNPYLNFSPMLNRTESIFKSCHSLLMQHSQSKIVNIYWEAGVTLNCTGVIFVSIVSADSDLFSVNMHYEKT